VNLFLLDKAMKGASMSVPQSLNVPPLPGSLILTAAARATSREAHRVPAPTLPDQTCGRLSWSAELIPLHRPQEVLLRLRLQTTGAQRLQALRLPRVKTEAFWMARMDTNTPSSALEIPLVALSPVHHLTMETTDSVSVPVMQMICVVPGHGFLFPPLPIAEGLVISRGDHKHALSRTEMV